jgi:hypothetical protein
MSARRFFRKLAGRKITGLYELGAPEIHHTRLMDRVVHRRGAAKYQTINDQNRWAVRLVNSRDLLLGRTLIVTATKPA